MVSGFTMGLGLVRALGECGVPVVVLHYDERDFAQCSRYVTASHKVAHPEHAADEFIGAVLGLADRYRHGVLFPASDESLATLSRHRSTLAEHFTLACMGWNITEQLLDKRYTYAAARRAGVPAPETILPTSEEEVREYAARVRFPCLVKPTLSHRFYERFGRKMVSVESVGQMVAAFREASAANLDVMLQEFIPGDDCEVANYNAYVADGRVAVEFTADHIRAGPPRLGSPRVAMSRVIPELIEPGRKLLQALGFSGYACTEFKRDRRDGLYKLMEVNGRHNLSTLLAVRCGVNFPWLHYQHLVHGEVPSASPYRTGVYWIDLVRDLGYSMRFVGREEHSLAAYVRPYLRPHVDAILDWRDPKPFLKRSRYLLRSPMRAVRRAVSPSESPTGRRGRRR